MAWNEVLHQRCSEAYPQKLVKQAVKTWLQMKPRRKLPKYNPSAAAKEAASPTIVLAEAAVQSQ